MRRIPRPQSPAPVPVSRPPTPPLRPVSYLVPRESGRVRGARVGASESVSWRGIENGN